MGTRRESRIGEFRIRTEGRQVLDKHGHEGDTHTEVRQAEPYTAEGPRRPTKDERPRDSTLVLRQGKHREIVAGGASMGNRKSIRLPTSRHRQGDETRCSIGIHQAWVETLHSRGPTKNMEVDKRPVLCSGIHQGRTTQGHKV